MTEAYPNCEKGMQQVMQHVLTDHAEEKNGNCMVSGMEIKSIGSNSMEFMIQGMQWNQTHASNVRPTSAFKQGSYSP